MQHHLNLIKNEVAIVEKRVFPRFPFTYLTFKSESCVDAKVFEVVDISETGMQLCLKSGKHSLLKDSEIKGALHWKSAKLNASCKVEWLRGDYVGLSFNMSVDFAKSVKHFLGLKQIAECMQPIHDTGLELEVPANLKYWLRSDGPCEVFVWTHPDGELAKFEFILFSDFIEWNDGKGVQTGKVINKRDLETPLNSEDEFMVQIDQKLDNQKLSYAKELLQHLGERHLPFDIRAFLQRKISH